MLRSVFDLQREDASRCYNGVAGTDRMLAQGFADFIDGEHAGANVNIVNLGLFQRVESAVLLPDKFNVGKTKVASNDEVYGVGKVTKDRHKAFRSGLLHTCLCGSAVHDTDKLLGRETEGIT